MLRQVVLSSSLRSVGYDAAKQELEVEFKNGGIYRYSEVEPAVARGLLRAESKGSYFLEHVRDKFSTTKVS